MMKWIFVTCSVHTASKLFSAWESLLFLSGIKMILPRKAENARYSLYFVASSSHKSPQRMATSRDIEGKERSDSELFLFLKRDIRNDCQVKFLIWGCWSYQQVEYSCIPGREIRAVKIVGSIAQWKVKFFSLAQACSILFIYSDWEKMFIVQIKRNIFQINFGLILQKNFYISIKKRPKPKGKMT